MRRKGEEGGGGGSSLQAAQGSAEDAGVKRWIGLLALSGAFRALCINRAMLKAGKALLKVTAMRLTFNAT